jgi:hypothetical protein
MSESDDALDLLLDATLDDLDDLPSFEPFTPGAHRCLATMEAKTINSKPSVELTLKLIETMELADSNTPEEEQSKPDDVANTLFFMDNEIGQGKFKACAANFVELAGSAGLRAIVDAVKEVEVMVVTSITIDKNDKTRKYLNLIDIQVV